MSPDNTDEIDKLLSKEYLTDVGGNIIYFVMEPGNLDSRIPANQAIQSLINEQTRLARIEEVNWLRKNWEEYMLPEDEGMFDKRIAELRKGGDK